jgi:hypothetical protein
LTLSSQLNIFIAGEKSAKLPFFHAKTYNTEKLPSCYWNVEARYLTISFFFSQIFEKRKSLKRKSLKRKSLKRKSLKVLKFPPSQPSCMTAWCGFGQFASGWHP